jgi:hypothetical protein
MILQLIVWRYFSDKQCIMYLCRYINLADIGDISSPEKKIFEKLHTHTTKYIYL